MDPDPDNNIIIDTEFEFEFLAQLYQQDAPDSVLLTEYPSSNSLETYFQNRDRFIIHDPFPPPSVDLLTQLGPHHLMCGWGSEVKVTSQVVPSEALLEHWKSIFGSEGVPRWESFDSADREKSYLTIFPHEKISASQQAVNPEVNYFLHSKEVIEKIACPQAAVLPRVSYPCVAKLTHGYAALGNFFLRNSEDEREMRNRLADQWPDAKLVVNSMIENIVDDFGVQFYIQKNGGVIWLGLTEQQFDDSFRWCGGVYSHDQQTNLFESLRPFVAATGDYLARRGYFGVAGIDVVQNSSGDMFLVDVNPRLTGVSPFLIASRIFAKKEGWKEGAYHASLKFQGTMDELISKVESVSKARAMVLSAVERTKQGFTICHFSVNSDSQERNLKVVLEIFG